MLQVKAALLALYGYVAQQRASSGTRSLLDDDDEIQIALNVKRTLPQRDAPWRMYDHHTAYNHTIARK